MSEPRRREEPRAKRRRRHRSRPVPKWIREKQELDEMARRRCLLVLSVLSGEKPVTDAIAEAGLSRNTYYQLEEKALEAMLAALGPSPGPGRPPDRSAEIAALEQKVTRLEQEKRRAERLLMLTRKVVRTGRLTVAGLGRPRSTTSGSKPSSTSGRSSAEASPSTPTPAGGDGR
jgi:hypothetical protein